MKKIWKPLVGLLLLISACTDSSDSENTVWNTESDSDTTQILDCSNADEHTDWVFVEGGTYQMGYPIVDGINDAMPLHDVHISDMCVWRTEVTVAQYLECVYDGECNMPANQVERCNIDKTDKDDYPANCINWDEAIDFCTYAGGRLISESEWEFLARNRGKEDIYPWGDAEPTCDLAVIDEPSVGCGTNRTWPVCSKPLGNTEQGLCDMAGNVYEWTGDFYHPGYEWEFEGETFFAPDDGSYWQAPAPPDGNGDHYRIMRGCGIGSMSDYRNRKRVFHDRFFNYSGLGIRCVKN